MPTSDASALLPGVSFGLGQASQNINNYLNHQNNEKQRKWTEKMYQTQRQDSLADWTMQNNYNSPEAQMLRLKNAGLNPNLVYGNGATQQAGAVRSSEAGSYNPQASTQDLGSGVSSGLSAYYDTQIKDATVQNLKQQNQNLQQEYKNKQAMELATIASTGLTESNKAKTDFELYMSNRLKDITYEGATLQNKKLSADITYTLNQDVRAGLSNDMSLREALSRISRNVSQNETDARMRQQIQQTIRNLQQDERTKRLENNLRENGLNPSDPMYQRVLGQLISGDSSPLERGVNWMLGKDNTRYIDSTFNEFKKRKK